MTLDEFIRRVDSLPEEPGTGCKIWVEATLGGYPGPRIDKKQCYGNRLVLEKKLGRPIRLGYFALHECDTPLCVNEDHIYEGTQQDNMRDVVKRGRHISQVCPERYARGDKSGARLYPEKWKRGDEHWSRLNPEKLTRGNAHWTRDPKKSPKGEKNGRAKINGGQVREIRAKFEQGHTLAILSEEYGVCGETIRSIVQRKSWAHIA